MVSVKHGKHWIMRVALVLMLMLVWGGLLCARTTNVRPAQAQSSNLLQNATFDGSYTGRSNISGGVPDGWQVWGDFQDSNHESLSVLVASSPYSWRLRTNSGQPTGGGYQTVSVASGTRYQFSIYAMIWTCDDEEWQCRDSTSTWSDSSSGGRVRIGIDPTGGTNPWGSSVVWSGFASPMTWGSFGVLTVEATASSSQVTVFTYFGSDKAMRFNDIFWDNASLVAVSGSTTSTSGSSSSSNTQTTVATVVPVENDPVTRADGSVVHVVQAGQTLWAISQVYGLSVETLMALNGLSSTTIYIGQQIIIQAASVTATPVATVAALVPTATPFPTVISGQVVTVTPFGTPVSTQVDSQDGTPVAVNVDDTAAEEDDSGGAITGTTRTVVLAIAVIVILGAVGATGALAGYIGYRIFRA